MLGFLDLESFFHHLDSSSHFTTLSCHSHTFCSHEFKNYIYNDVYFQQLKVRMAVILHIAAMLVFWNGVSCNLLFTEFLIYCCSCSFEMYVCFVHHWSFALMPGFMFSLTHLPLTVSCFYHTRVSVLCLCSLKVAYLVLINLFTVYTRV